MIPAYIEEDQINPCWIPDTGPMLYSFTEVSLPKVRFLFAYLRALKPGVERPFSTVELLGWVNHITEAFPTRVMSQEHETRRKAEARLLTLRNLRRAVDLGRLEGRDGPYFVLENDEKRHKKVLLGKQMEFTWLDFLRILAWRLSLLAGVRSRAVERMSEDECLKTINEFVVTDYRGMVVPEDVHPDGPVGGAAYESSSPMEDVFEEMKMVAGIRPNGDGLPIRSDRHVEVLFSGYELVSPERLPQPCIDAIRKALFHYLP